MNGDLTFVLEKKSDALLLKCLLERCFPQCHFSFYAAQGQLMLTSLAIAIAIDMRCPLMIIGDTGRLDPQAAIEFKTEHLEWMQKLLPFEAADAFAFSPTFQEVVEHAISGDFQSSKIPSLAQAVGHTSPQHLGGQPQLAKFFKAIEALQSHLPPPLSESTLSRADAYAMQ
jgi:hypothetical protein